MIVYTKKVRTCKYFNLGYTTPIDTNQQYRITMKELKFAFTQTIPILFTYLFIGIAYGILMAEAGFGTLWSFFSALFIFAGSMQIVMIPLLQHGTSFVTLTILTLFINARHLFYGIGFIEKFRTMGWRYPYLVVTLTDETFSVLSAVTYEEGLDEKQAAFYIAMLNHLYWVIGCSLGAAAGKLFSWDMAGIEFSATALFTVVVVNHWFKSPSKVSIYVGIVSAVLYYLLLGPDKFLLPAISASLITMMLMKDSVLQRIKGAADGI